MKVLLVHPGASWSTADVEAGLRYGLETHNVEIVKYRLDGRIERSGRWLHTIARRARKHNPEIPKPTTADIFYQAGIGVLEKALRHQVDVVLVVSAMYLHPDVLILLRRAGVKTVILFTESPYDLEKELKIAELVDGCWTNERSVVPRFQGVNPNSGYLPHSWHPERHYFKHEGDSSVASHDVVFVGTAFRERVDWFRSINWTGIDLGLYGSWLCLGSRNPLRKHLQSTDPVPNIVTGALYRRSKIGLNIYRKSMGFGKNAPFIKHAESMNPREYELAACGAFHLSEYRQEIGEVFGDLVPTFHTAEEASDLIQEWLPRERDRLEIERELPAKVAESSWVERSTRVIGDLQSLFGLTAEEKTKVG